MTFRALYYLTADYTNARVQSALPPFPFNPFKSFKSSLPYEIINNIVVYITWVYDASCNRPHSSRASHHHQTPTCCYVWAFTLMSGVYSYWYKMRGVIMYGHLP